MSKTSSLSLRSSPSNGACLSVPDANTEVLVHTNR